MAQSQESAYQLQKDHAARRRPFAVKRSNWIDGNPPTCAIHDITAIWHRNKARESGGQWVCKECSRLKARGQKRRWRTEHTDPFTYNLKRAFCAAKFHSKTIGRAFAIGFDDVLDLWKSQGGRCAISGDEMQHLPGDRKRNRYKMTMDRIDSSRGYEHGNVWLVCDWVNRAKSDLTGDELLRFAHGVLRGWSQSS